MEQVHKNKKLKLSSNNENDQKTCKHFVTRKKRLCKMTVAKGKEYCGEHDPTKDDEKNDLLRIPCPLDPKHTVYKIHLQKHLKICNARPKLHPKYIVTDINAGSDDELTEPRKDFKISDIPIDEMSELIKKIENLYEKFKLYNINELIFQHKILESEMQREDYGKETLKHLIQTASILGYLENYDLLKDETSFIEFGAGKGQLAYWLAKVIANEKKSASVLLLDRASHRHKKDNKLDDKNSVHRIRVDIKDFNLTELDIVKNSKCIVAISKHLCGAATDLTFRCLLKENTTAFLVALCCHHRCEWKSFVGKKFFIENNLKYKDFLLMTKMVSWAICGTGMSRERRKELNDGVAIVSNNQYKLTLEEREEIGKKCKRILDYSRLVFMESQGFECSLKFYVKNNVTLENVCIIGRRNNKN